MSTHSQDLSRTKIKTIAGQKAKFSLDHDEPLIFDQNTPGTCGVDWPDIHFDQHFLGDLMRENPVGWPGLSEPFVTRHFTRLSRKNYAIDMGIYPLGSCTMKHNPRLNEKVARFFSHVHPLQPALTIQGCLSVIKSLCNWLKELTGMVEVVFSPAAGAHGELCGMMVIKNALKHRGEANHRLTVLIPDSAHGTNPATCSQLGFSIKTIPVDPITGQVQLAAIKQSVDDTLAGIMLTNPNTCGIFEKDIIQISKLIHDVGGCVYCDGANFNALVGKMKPADLGIDCMHINLHKTFSTPHGGGGPGSGPVVFSGHLAPYIMHPHITELGDHWGIDESSSLGRIKAFYGQMGMFIRALAFMMSHGKDGLKKVSEDAVLNANYILHELRDMLSQPFKGSCVHEALFDDTFLKETSVSTLDLAKALIDEGVHPMTMYFPLIISGAILIEPTESESKASLDAFIQTMRLVVAKAKEDPALLKEAPAHAPMRRLDETKAAREPHLRWYQQKPD